MALIFVCSTLSYSHQNDGYLMEYERTVETYLGDTISESLVFKTNNRLLYIASEGYIYQGTFRILDLKLIDGSYAHQLRMHFTLGYQNKKEAENLTLRGEEMKLDVNMHIDLKPDNSIFYLNMKGIGYYNDPYFACFNDMRFSDVKFNLKHKYDQGLNLYN